MNPEWVRSLRDQCQRADVAFHFKQWGQWCPDRSGAGVNAKRIQVFDAFGKASTIVRLGKHAAGRRLDGETWDEFPVTASLFGQTQKITAE